MLRQKSDREERLQVMLSPEELAAIDSWRFSRRMPSRAAAIRELLRLGMEAEGIHLAASGETSSSYGVVNGGRTDAKTGEATTKE